MARMKSSTFYAFHRRGRQLQAGSGMRSSASPSSPLAVRPLAAPVLAVLGAIALLANPAAAQRNAPPHLNTPETPRKIDNAPEARAQRLRPVRNWGYWLSSFAINDVVTAPHDLIGRRQWRLRQPPLHARNARAEEVARMKQRPDGSSRVLLAYLSFGEAERYRAYWRPEWYDRNKKPAWLGTANPEWDGNYFVQILGARVASLDVRHARKATSTSS